VCRGETFCAVQLSVKFPDGTPVPAAIADLIDPNGQIAQSRRVVQGSASFCDFGFGRHSIRIHALDSDCASTLIENIRLEYGYNQKLSVIFNSCPFEGDAAGNACFTYIRVISEAGQALPGVMVSDSMDRSGVATDSYGRTEVNVHVGSRSDFELRKPGFRPATMHLECPAFGRGVKERLVTLQGGL
jgi:hypothetical protein